MVTLQLLPVLPFSLVVRLRSRSATPDSYRVTFPRFFGSDAGLLPHTGSPLRFCHRTHYTVGFTFIRLRSGPFVYVHTHTPLPGCYYTTLPLVAVTVLRLRLRYFTRCRLPFRLRPALVPTALVCTHTLRYHVYAFGSVTVAHRLRSFTFTVPTPAFTFTLRLRCYTAVTTYGCRLLRVHTVWVTLHFAFTSHVLVGSTFAVGSVPALVLPLRARTALHAPSHAVHVYYLGSTVPCRTVLVTFRYAHVAVYAVGSHFIPRLLQFYGWFVPPTYTVAVTRDAHRTLRFNLLHILPHHTLRTCL